MPNVGRDVAQHLGDVASAFGFERLSPAGLGDASEQLRVRVALDRVRDGDGIDDWASLHIVTQIPRALIRPTTRFAHGEPQ